MQSVDNYGESGVLFKGNIRSGAQPSAVQQKLQSKLREQMPDYSLFLMVDRDDKPTVGIVDLDRRWSRSLEPIAHRAPRLNSQFSLALGHTRVASLC